MLEATGLTRRDEFHDVTLAVRPGEILGIAGLVGSGRSELLMTLAGASTPQTGRSSVRGAPRRIRSVRDAQRPCGIALVPESRKLQGLHLDHSIERNITLPHLARSSRDRSDATPGQSWRTAAAGVADRSQGTQSVAAPVRTLSGGNQQRVLFAKWLVDRPEVLLVDEPTRGVDVQGKNAIYQLIADLAALGTAIVVVSSETSEVIGLSHRILVLHQGRVAAELIGDDISEEHIVKAAFGGASRTDGETAR